MPNKADALRLLARSARPSNAYEETMQRLLQSIRLGLFFPDERLPSERELAAMLKVSRDTVRVAISTLSESGYVRSKRGRYGGTFVANPIPRGPGNVCPEWDRRTRSSDEVEDTARLRRILEVGAAREAASRELPSSERNSLSAALEAALNADFETHRRFDSRLHLVIAELSGAPSLVPLIADLRSRVNSLLDCIPMLQPNLTHSNSQHESIVAAILAGRPEAAATAMLEHVEGSTALLRGFFAAPADLPTDEPASP